MVELVLIVEGQTEQTFVRDVLSGHLALRGINSWAVLSGRHRKHGGVKHWDAARGDIIRTLKEGRFCSTMFDYYALPNDWPGRPNSAKLSWNVRANYVEAAIHQDVTNHASADFDGCRFIPYVQIHEFEALLFADPEVTGKYLETLQPQKKRMDQERLVRRLTEIVTAAGAPEAINDPRETCPSRRIAGLVSSYQKVRHGPSITEKIGLLKLRERCDHFRSWMERLEQIAPS